ncbi:GNAT family N-acetyltransferase [Piscinibacter sakaiensis]|uniref:GNAT family N-acetyltransferase n=1 Tax=Piscinibacter sakaiensis TaxID=1547922 RepID=UPI003AAFC3F5
MTDLNAFPQLATQRLWLREIVDADSAALYAIHGNPEVRRWFGSDPLASEDEARALVRSFAGWRELVNPGTRWGLERKDQPGLIGSCGLFSWNRQWRKCTIGYEIAPEAGGQGLMTEALVAIIGWGFAQMQLNRIDAQIHPDNTRSITLVRKLGFVEEGRLREIAYWGGRHHDMLQFSLLRREWQRAP